MRVAYVCADRGVPIFGRKGCSVHVREVVAALRHAGADVHLFAAQLGGPPPVAAHGIPVTALPCPGKGDGEAREKAALASNAALRAALCGGAPFDLVYERYSLWSFAGMEYARDHGAVGILEVNAPLVEEQATHRTLVDRNGAEQVAERAFAAASAVLAVSDPLAQWLERHAAAHGKVHVVPNGVDTDRFGPGVRASRPAGAGSFTVGFVGTLKPWHGLAVLAEAFARLREARPEARLLVVGDGPERAGFEAALTAHGVRGAAELTGAVEPDDVPGLLASMDAAVAPYPSRDGFYFSPLKVYEYMAAGLPVVASRIGQIEDAIRDGEDGLLCPAGDARGLADTLARLAADAPLRQRLGAQARRRVVAERTWRAVADRILTLAQALAERRVVTAAARTA